jgi:PDZ domain
MNFKGQKFFGLLQAGVLSLLCAACMLDPISLVTYAVAEAHTPAGTYDPKLEKEGLELLYSLKASDLERYFPLGTSREAIERQYGKPQHAFAAANGASVLYSHTRTYSHMQRNGQHTYVSLNSSLSLGFDASGRQISQSLNEKAYVVDSANTSSREASESEVVRYLGARPPLPVSAFAPAGSASGRASSASTVAPAAPQTTSGWRVGVGIAPVGAAEAGAAGTRAGVGAYIREIERDGLAARAGARVGDVVLRLNGAEISSPADLVQKIRSSPTSENLTLQVINQGRLRTLTIPAMTPARGAAETDL